MFEIVDQLALVVITEGMDQLEPVGRTGMLLQVMDRAYEAQVAAFLLGRITKVFLVMILQVAFALLQLLRQSFNRALYLFVKARKAL